MTGCSTLDGGSKARGDRRLRGCTRRERAQHLDRAKYPLENTRRIEERHPPPEGLKRSEAERP